MKENTPDYGVKMADIIYALRTNEDPIAMALRKSGMVPFTGHSISFLDIENPGEVEERYSEYILGIVKQDIAKGVTSWGDVCLPTDRYDMFLDALRKSNVVYNETDEQLSIRVKNVHSIVRKQATLVWSGSVNQGANLASWYLYDCHKK